MTCLIERVVRLLSPPPQKGTKERNIYRYLRKKRTNPLVLWIYERSDRLALINFDRFGTIGCDCRWCGTPIVRMRTTET